MNTAQALERIKRMSKKDKAAFDAVLDTMPKWVPQHGPQRMAYESQADILFYGGAAGGGKTALMLGLCLTQHSRSIVFRREAVQLTGLEEDMRRILGGRNGYNSQSGVWRLPDGRVMEFGSVAQPEDWVKYQGRPHDLICVGKGTLVRMADKSYKEIQLIEIGEFVDTLDGAKCVNRTFTMHKPSVLAKAIVDGVVVARQIQSKSHALLSDSGWIDAESHSGLFATTQRHACDKCESRSSLIGAGLGTHLQHPSSGLWHTQAPHQHSGQRPCEAGQNSSIRREVCASISHCCACKSEAVSFQIHAATDSTQTAKPTDLTQQSEPSLSDRDHQSPQGFCAAVATPTQGTGCVGFVYRLSAAALRFSEIVRATLLRPFLGLLAQGSLRPSSDRAANDALSVSKPVDCQDGCLSSRSLCGGQLRRAQARGPKLLLLLDGVAQQTPIGFAGDAQDETHRHIRRGLSYDHPYTKDARRTEAEFLEASLEFSDVGKLELFDLTVEGSNHYITAGGFVNRNCFDELSHFLEPQFRALIGWLRSDDATQRQRVVCAGNPPTSSDGAWVKRFWGAWLDPTHQNPAKPGELRWYVTNEAGDDMEVPSGDPYKVGAETFTPKSRTFIPSSVDDNIFLSSTGYKATLQSLPEPLRSQMLRGDFNAGASDPAWQLIPTDWVKAAQSRWEKRAVKGPMTAIGFDPARGGVDKSTAARRHGAWFDEMVSVPGSVTADGPAAAGFIVPLIRNGACVCVDAIGIGSSALDFIRGLNLNVLPVVGSAASGLADKAGQLRFKNKRAEMYWLLREALDPVNPVPVSLPPDQELLGDLCSVRYKVVSMGKMAAIQIREKDEIRETLGRSPDKGDAVAMTFVVGIPAPNAMRQDYAPPPPPDWRL